MDLELREALALSDDRSDALAQLLPGSEDHDYYRGLRAQHAGALDEADAILGAWPERHGHTERYARLRLRQLLYRLARDPERAADEVRDQFGVSHWHEAEIEEVDPARPTRLPAGMFDGAALLRQAADSDPALSQVTDEGLLELLASPAALDPARRRVLLSRLHHSPEPRLVELVADDLAVRGSGGFGSLAIHGQLTLEQLRALAERRGELRAHAGWVAAVVQRLRPPASVDLELDLAARTAYLAELWQFVGALPPALNTLKAHVLWHLLDTTRRRDQPPPLSLVAAYLQLPRPAAYAARAWLERIRADQHAQLGADQRGVTGLTRAGDDLELVRDLLFRIYASGGDVRAFAEWLDAEWLDAERAEFALLTGGADADRAALVLGPARAAALRDRIELAWCPHNPTRFTAADPIALDVDVKHVGELLVKVFRIDPIAYFQSHRREVNTDLDLDGLAATHEIVLRFTEPAVRRVRRRIELPMCARAGTYVIDLFGNGMSSRAIAVKGRLRHVMRLGAAGHVITIVDEAGAPQPTARAFLGEREYVPDERGAIVVPFSTAPARTPILLACGDVASVGHVALQREIHQLALHLVLPREALAAGRTARAIARVSLTVAGAPASLALLRQPTWDVTLTDRHGVATTKSQPLAVDDHGAAVLEWPLGDDAAHVAIAVRGSVEVRSEQRTQELAAAQSAQIGTIHATESIVALYLARIAGGWVMHALGKTGEPRAQRAVTVALTHRWTRRQIDAELQTDAQGRIELGELPGIAQISAVGDTWQSWSIDEDRVACRLHAPAGAEILVPVPPDRAVADVLRRASLVELRGDGAVVRHVACEIEALAGGIALRGLPPGDYELRSPGVHVAIAVAAAGARVDGAIVTGGEIIEVPPAVPVIASVDTGDGLRVVVRGASPRTRVHAIATRFSPDFLDPFLIGRSHAPGRRADPANPALYVSGRELGDEYRYVLERRGAQRYPSLLVDKPSLLLNPWSRRTSDTGIAEARGGRAFAASPARPMMVGEARYGAPMAPAPAVASDEAFASYDFLPDASAVIANLVPDRDGAVHIPRARLGGAAAITIIVDDRDALAVHRITLGEPAHAPRDLRLQLALDPARHVTQKKAIAPLVAGARFAIEDLATARVHLIDTVERAHAYLLALRDDPTLREFAFVARWHALPDSERRELYSKYACHELHLFLYFKDRPFFDGVVRPYLAHKRTKTFVDHWLLDANLAPWLDPSQLARLNAVERALLARRMRADDALPRILGDQVALAPPDPATDTRLIDALLGASTLDGQDEEYAAAAEILEDDATGTQFEPAGGFGGGGGGPLQAAMAPSAKPERAKKRRAPADDKADRDEDTRETAVDALALDLARRQDAPRHYRTADKTQEWAEHNWWHRRPQESGAAMIAPNRLWRDLALHKGGGDPTGFARGAGVLPRGIDGARPFLSRWLGLGTGSFAEAMCALAVTELPFVAGAHQYAHEPPRLAITAASHALVGSSQILDGELVTGGPPLVVGTSYVRADDRYDWSSGEQVDKYVAGPFATGVVYVCQIVLANPTSARQRISALVQIPRGSIAVGGARPTQTIDVALAPYGTHGHHYAFYFPAPGAWSHFPVHVSRHAADGDLIVAADAPRTLVATSGGGAPDPASWSHVSQRGSLAEVVAHLAAANLAATDLTRVAWRVRARAPYDAILAALERRHAYDETLWGYALLHRDRPRIRAWLRALGDRLLAAGPVIDTAGLDAEALDAYEHLELAPLINARAHRLGPKLRILNEGLAAQYEQFLELVAHRSAPAQEDLLAAAAYLLAQDRVEAALGALARVSPDSLTDRMQHDYLAAYAACLTGDLAAARERCARWREHPVDRWRFRFAALAAMLDEVGGTAAAGAVDPRSREQALGERAATQPTFELAVDRDGVVVRSRHVAALELRFFEMDVELLFSRQPFVQSDVSRFSFIEPGHRELLAEPPPEHRVAWPAALRGKNVVVEAVGAGQRAAKVHYANALATSLANQVGQLRVQRVEDHSPLPATYVKVYARKRGGAVAFYKDGYTDLRGWFDYASLSTTDLDDVERFAILVCSDRFGAAILEASPPQR